MTRLVWIILFLPSLCVAQKAIRGRVIDAITLMPLSAAGVYAESTDCRTITNDSGYFELPCTFEADSNLTIAASYVGYSMLLEGRQEFNLSKGGFITLKLNAVPMSLDTVTIAPGINDIFFGASNRSVVDYIPVKNGWLVGMYDPFSKSWSLLVLSNSKKIVFTTYVPGNLKGLYASCINRYYAMVGNKVYEISIATTGIKLSSISTSYFYNAIQYYVGFHDPYFYITGFSTDQLDQGFFLENTITKVIEKIPFTAVPRDHERKQMRASYKRQAKLKEARLKDPTSFWPKPHDPSNTLDKYYASDGKEFFEEAYREISFEAIWSPFFVTDSNLVLVNYPQNLIEHYAFNSDFIDTFSMNLHYGKGRIKQTLYDEVTGLIYFIVEDKDNRRCFELNQRDGTCNFICNIIRSDSELPRARGGYLYYISGRDNGHTYLYRQKLEKER